jgi:outer membrane receptor protein involved in Fe transport
MHPTTSKIAVLMGSASLLTMANALGAQAQQVAQAQMAQATSSEVPEQVLITGSLIRGTAAVGVPVTNLGVQDFTQTGNVTIGDLFRTVPQANVAPGPSAVNSGGHQERETRVNIRGLDQTGPRTLLMVDGARFPPQADGICAVDPSIIPALALDRVDILADGASATYGSDAVAGVINIVLKRGYEGALTLLHFQMPDHGGKQYQASQLYGRTWDGGDITLTYEWLDEQPGPRHRPLELHDELHPVGTGQPDSHCRLDTRYDLDRRGREYRQRPACDHRYELHQLLGHSARHRSQLPRRHWPDHSFQRSNAQLGALLRQRSQ